MQHNLDDVAGTTLHLFQSDTAQNNEKLVVSWFELASLSFRPPLCQLCYLAY